MNPPMGSEPFRFDERQERIHRMLLRIGKGPAEFFQDACRIMAARPTYTTATHLVAHLLRDTEGALLRVLLPEERPADSPPPRHKDPNAHRTKVLRILTALDIPEGDPVAQVWLRFADKDSSHSLHRWAHRDALRAPRPVDAAFERVWNDVQLVLERVLDRFEPRHIDIVYPKLNRLVGIIEPTPADAAAFIADLPAAFPVQQHALDQVASRAWLRTLHEAGFFTRPADIERHPDGAFSLPPWAASRYLVRMVPIVPDLCAEILIEIPLVENDRVHDDLCAAAIELPAADAARWAEREAAWLRARDHLYTNLPYALSELALRLIGNGEEHAGLQLASALIEVREDLDAARKRTELAPFDTPQARVKVSFWTYGEIVRALVAGLVPASADRGLDLFMRLLADAVAFGARDPQDAPEDYSFVWRTSIASDDTSEHYGAAQCLISAVRDLAIAVAATSPHDARGVIGRLRAHRWRVFERIALHVLRSSQNAPPDLILAAIEDWVGDPRVQTGHEAFDLAKDLFGSLAPGDRARLLDLIRRGVHRTAIAMLLATRKETSVTPEVVEHHRKRWLLARLEALAGHLPSDLAGLREELQADLGETGRPRPAITVRSGWEQPDPDTKRLLEESTLESLLGLLGELGRAEFAANELRKRFGQDPELIASHVAAIIAARRAGIRAAITGAQSALNAGKPLPWDTLLSVCEAARETEAARDVADLLRKALEGEGSLELSFAFRDRVWRLLARCFANAPPPGEGEARDLVSVAINSRRGRVLETILEYSVWVRRHLERASTATGFDPMPEVRELLEQVLREEGSIAIRVVFGLHLSRLVYLDGEWVRAHVTDVIPEPASTRVAVWDAYIRYNRPYAGILEMLRSQYADAIERIDLGARVGHDSPEAQLAAHLMVFYARGNLSLDDSLLARFFEKANVALRAHAIGILGRQLCNAKDGIAPETLARLARLWERRLSGATRLGSAERRSELQEFGWWFGSGRFETAWALARLLDTLSLSTTIEADWLVLEQLRVLAATHPVKVAACLDRYVQGVENDERLTLSHDDISAALRSILASGIPEAITGATAVIGRLVHRGHFAFQNLLPA